MQTRSILNHPILLFGIFTWIIRMSCLVFFYMSDISLQEKFSSFIYAAISHSLLLAFVVVILMILANVLFRFEMAIKIFSAYTLLMSFIICNIDLVLLRFTGNKFTPEVLKFYGLKYVFHPQVLNAIVSNPLSLAIMIAAIVFLILAFVYINKKVAGYALESKVKYRYLTAALLVVLIPLTVIESKSQLYLSETRPPEIVFTKSILGTESFSPNTGQIKYAKEQIRKYLKISDTDIVNEDFPLLHHLSIDSGALTIEQTGSKEYPDIFLIAIESLRGNELRFTKSSNDFAHTPTIDSLANHSLVFPRFISNGWPSEEGFFCTMTAGFPHRLKHISASYKDVNFDCLPKRLASVGYTTASLWGTSPAYRIADWSDTWFEHNYYPPRDVWHTSDAVFFENVVQRIKEHDQQDQPKPLFMHIKNGDTHMPFETAAGHFANDAQRELAEQYSIPGDKYSRDKYKKALEWTDLQLAQLLQYLRERERSDNSIIILMGDHSILVNESFGHGVRMAPSNAYVHTGALISGPERLLGKMPRVFDFPSSQVDIMPTILTLIGFDKPIAAWGQSLLTDMPPEKRTSIAVRPGVFRIDFNHTTAFVNANNPTSYWNHDFYDLSYTKQIGLADKTLADHLDQLYTMMYYWSYLLENDRVLPVEELNSNQ